MALRIKKDIDLKELEKFGFKKKEYINDLDIKEWYDIPFMDEEGNIIDTPKLDKDDINWSVYEKRKNIDNFNSVFTWICIFDKTENPDYIERQIIPDEHDIDIIYDLIKADMVEKVEG